VDQTLCQLDLVNFVILLEDRAWWLILVNWSSPISRAVALRFIFGNTCSGSLSMMSTEAACHKVGKVIEFLAH
jgi:hypothetical protein